ncbi:spliceosome complex protein [Calocera viscosa TUFC12733]|uniref:Pre-mRNA-splicing factor SYF1 n=1 Tax=Calocera viscosa (strain TUFC12733) TaxID=1330018 RepID=A0A167Q7H3_CALVF|nr:spliceosome complex protein [Calocera viscosa TUFC12733]
MSLPPPPFPLTPPPPPPLSHPALLPPSSLTQSEDLLRNPHSFRHHWTALSSLSASSSAHQRASRPPEGSPSSPLGAFTSLETQLQFQRLVYLYESALQNFPQSFKLWKSYLLLRRSYVLGSSRTFKRAGGRRKAGSMRELMEDEAAGRERWEGWVDPVLGWEEWKSLVAVCERAVMWLPTMPRIWLLYLSIFQHPALPAPISHTHARRTFDRALRTLPPSLHPRIWPLYMHFAESRGGGTMISVYRRFLAVDDSLSERFARLLLGRVGQEEDADADDDDGAVATALLLPERRGAPRPLEAAKLLLSLARRAAAGSYTSPAGTSPYALLLDFLEVAEGYAEDVGFSPDDDDEAPAKGGEETDMRNGSKLDVERIVKEDGLEVYKDQAGRLWTGLATYWTKRGDFDRAKDTFEQGQQSVLTVRDFTQIFDAYAEFSESLISALMEALPELEAEEAEETERELDGRMRDFELLMDRRPFLVNEVMLRRNPNDVQEWEKRVALHGGDDENVRFSVAKTYELALSTISPKRATANLHQLYIHFARFYEQGGATREAEPDLKSARRVLERATHVGFRNVDDLAEVWCEWAELELRAENYDEAIRVMQRATAVPKNTKVQYHDASLPVQARLFKSLKLWSFYVDLEESIGSVQSTKQAYEKILELKIANAQVIINYAAFLEDNKYFEESFRVYERGVELFTFPIAFEIWNIYLSKFVKRYGGSKLERARDLFEQALEKCPPKQSKPLFLMYARLEEDYGLAKRAMAIYDRSTSAVADEDKFEMFTIYIAKAAANFGLPATRPIYERALEVLPDAQTAQMCLRFAALERKLGEIDRARAIYAHASQFCDPRVHADFWQEWNAFEIETGSEDTFREMLRIKRSVQAQYNTEVSFLAAQAVAARKGERLDEDERVRQEDNADPMAAAERAAVKGPAFVAARDRTSVLNEEAVNEDEIRMEMDAEDDDE